ncbi:hypothetical protein ACTA71_006460 [Dictyostelium dimigraforme]
MVSSLEDMLKYDEGERLIMYQDTQNYYTIGIGHKITDSKNKEDAIKALEDQIGGKIKRDSEKITISNIESGRLFEMDKSEAINSIQNNSTLSAIYNNLDSNRQMALINMVFQMGAGGVLKFTKSLKLIEEKKWDEAAAELKNSIWNSQTTNRSNRVISVFKTGTLDAYK